MKVAETHIAQTEAGWAADQELKRQGFFEESIQYELARRKRGGNCLFALEQGRKAQLKVGARCAPG